MTAATTEFCEHTIEVTVRAMHNLQNTALTPDENRALYGPCYGQHGHHYKVRVTLAGEIEEPSGFIFSRDRLMNIIENAVLKPFDGSDLNELFPNTACEALARSIYLRLKPLFPDGVLARIGIQETRKNYFEYPAQ